MPVSQGTSPASLASASPKGVQPQIAPELRGRPAIAEAAGRLERQAGELDLHDVRVVGRGLIAIGEQTQLPALAVFAQHVKGVLPGIQLRGVLSPQVQHRPLDDGGAADAQTFADRIKDVRLVVFGARAAFEKQGGSLAGAGG